MKQFYTHLIEIESIIVELDKLDLSKEQRVHLATLVDSSLQHTILDAILSQLNDQEKRVFMQHLTKGNHEIIWKFLNEKIDKVEDKVKAVAEDLKVKLHKDLKEARQRRGSPEATKKVHD